MALATTNGMSVDGLDAAPNGPGLVQQLGNQVDEFYGKSVADTAALPAAGKFTGQKVWLIDGKQHAVWTGSAWVIEPRMAGGKVPTTAPGLNFSSPVDNTVTFPTGRFDAVPVISFSIPAEGARCVVTHANLTNAGMTVRVFNATGSAAAAFTFHWTATEF